MLVGGWWLCRSGGSGGCRRCADVGACVLSVVRGASSRLFVSPC